jgi:hypothetical protein
MFTVKGLTWILTIASLGTPTLSAAIDKSQYSLAAIDGGGALQALGAIALAKSLALAAQNPRGGCTPDKVKIRKEW